MYQWVETIKVQNGEFINLRYHQYRFNHTRKSHFSSYREISLADILKAPESTMDKIYRCRVIYSREVEDVEFHVHTYRKVQSLKIVENNNLHYKFKNTGRQELETLFSQRGNADDILIVKNGYITDSFAANLVFFDGDTWWTPNTPLLQGTQRARLIDERKIQVCSIKPRDLQNFEKAGLISSMQDLNEMPVLSVKSIEGF